MRSILKLFALFPIMLPALAEEPGAAPTAPVKVERMTLPNALRYWDGVGELLMLPQPEYRSPIASLREILLRAAFDNRHFAKDRNESISDRDRCPMANFFARIERGKVQSTMTSTGARILSELKQIDGKDWRSFSTTTCRILMRFVVKAPTSDGWLDAPPAAKPLATTLPPSNRPPINLKPGQSVKITPEGMCVDGKCANPNALRRTPAEFGGVIFYSGGLNASVDADFAERCPAMYGMMSFLWDGVQFDLPVRPTDRITPGIRRDPDRKNTTIIFQNPECRYEIQVMREILIAGEWERSDIAQPPEPRLPEPEQDKPQPGTPRRL